MTFKETQKFSQPWIWVGLAASGIITAGLFGVGIYKQIIQGQQFGNHPMSDTGLIVAFILVMFLLLVIGLLFGLAKLTTLIDESGISYKFFPFHFKFRRIPWDSIEKHEVITYNPIRDYGGWGIKGNRHSKAYNVSGNKGLQVQLRNGETILIGTGKETELTSFLNKTT